MTTTTPTKIRFTKRGAVHYADDVDAPYYPRCGQTSKHGEAVETDDPATCKTCISTHAGDVAREIDDQELEALRLRRLDATAYAGTYAGRSVEYRRERFGGDEIWNITVDGVFVGHADSLDDCAYTAREYIEGKLGTARFEKRRVLRKYSPNTYPAEARWHFELAVHDSETSNARQAWDERAAKDGASPADAEDILDILPFEATRAELKKYQYFDR